MLSDENQEYKHVSHKTVFYDLLDSPLLTSAEKSPETLKDEAAGLAGAGIETSKRALAVASFFVLADERILRCLRQELQAAIADPSQIPTLPELEALPYLSAVINEGEPSMGLVLCPQQREKHQLKDTHTHKKEVLC